MLSLLRPVRRCIPTLALASSQRFRMDSALLKWCVEHAQGYQIHPEVKKMVVPVKESISHYLDKVKEVEENIQEAKELGDEDFLKEVTQQGEADLEYTYQVSDIDEKIFALAFPRENHSHVMVDISPGAGGDTATAFVRSLGEMYAALSERMGWSWEVLEETEETNVGGLKSIQAEVSGDLVWSYMQLEAGVVRQQLIPSNSDRMQTVSATIGVSPKYENLEVELLEKDLNLTYKRCTGPGGSSVNRANSAVRVIHIPTGITVVCQVHNNAIDNRKEALMMLGSRVQAQRDAEYFAKLKNLRSSQVASRNWSDKYRTFNMQEGFVIDHRSGLRGDPEEMLASAEGLYEMMEHVRSSDRAEKISQAEAILAAARDEVLAQQAAEAAKAA